MRRLPNGHRLIRTVSGTGSTSWGVRTNHDWVPHRMNCRGHLQDEASCCGVASRWLPIPMTSSFCKSRQPSPPCLGRRTRHAARPLAPRTPGRRCPRSRPTPRHRTMARTDPVHALAPPHPRQPDPDLPDPVDPHTVRIHRHRPGATDRPRSSLTPDRRQGWQPPSRPHRFGGVGGLTVPFMSRLER